MLTCNSDEFVFYKRFGVDTILLMVYVDDIVITGSDYVGIASLKSILQDQFHTKDLGSKIDRRSTTDYCVFVGGNLVS
ncbi:hypothetical protein LIER_35330 [Lithospermum erythrorhizon]|uniref:Reverse transcriptase Ty1/copia-type domain-containing protein n=1 Tax=Lithospermum erythrorhizon TaxID=34254 RepID=A0AAV3NNW5_LITER